MVHTYPKIPSEHKKYDLLPRCSKEHKDVVAFPTDMVYFVDFLAECVGLEAGAFDVMKFMPKKLDAPNKYIKQLEKAEKLFYSLRGDGGPLLTKLRELIEDLNDKENWSIVRFVGDAYDSLDEANNLYLTKGRCYYWPTSKLIPAYMGVFDNAESPMALYPLDKAAWEVVEDPTGMAARALSGEFDSIDNWYIDGENIAYEFENDFNQEFGNGSNSVGHAKALGGYPLIYEFLNKEFCEGNECDSNVATLGIECPFCNKDVEIESITFCDGEVDENQTQSIIDGTFFQKTCSNCGETLILKIPCLYIDAADDCAIQLVQSSQKRETEKLFNESEVSFCRYAETPLEFSEKVRIFADGFNDAPMELVKCAVRGSFYEKISEPFEQDFYVIYKEVLNENLVFQVVCGDERYTGQIDKKAYDVFAHALKKSEVPIEGSSCFVIDRNWAVNTLDKITIEDV